MKFVREHRKKFEITENSSMAIKLFHQIMLERYTDDEWLEIEEEAKEEKE